MSTNQDPLGPLRGHPFLIMDGAGNDFVIADLRNGGVMTEAAAIELGDREGMWGADQIIALRQKGGKPLMEIRNTDGSVAGACGNAARCVASILFEETDDETVTFGSPSGDLHAERLEESNVQVNMGPPRLEWQDVPLAEEAEDTRFVELPQGLLGPFGLKPPSCLSMGNPHAVFFVPDADKAEIEVFGPVIETNAAFPDRVNVSVASLTKEGLRVRTWERGVGMTRACGTAACASLVSAVRRNLVPRQAEIRADGGFIDITWDEETNDVLMAGPVHLHRKGRF
ncbi:MAG: diaminopimelate epimerase [Pseudomonadota bacterium]